MPDMPLPPLSAWPDSRTRRSTLRRTTGRVAAGVLTAQVVAAGALIAMDQVRKRRATPPEFPHSEPRDVPVPPQGTAKVYMYGDDVFADMLAAIDAARDRVYFETYMWKSDATGQAFKDAIVAAANRGLTVCVAFDVFANLVVSPSFLRFPPNVHVVRHPLTHVARNHRKVLVVDGEVAFVGGYNIGSVYATQWRDTHMRLTGPHVAEVENAFVDYWNARGGRPLLTDVRGRPWESHIEVHRNVPPDLVFPIRNMYLEAIDRAEHRIWLTHAYFTPDRTFLRVLIAAARRGVDVRIILPLDSNHVVADWISRSTFTELLDAGVRILRYRRAMVHAKTATIDSVWSTVGTANLDRLSLAGNHEINIELFDPAVAAEMERIFTLDSTNCAELSAADWRARPWIARFTEGLLSPWRAAV